MQPNREGVLFNSDLYCRRSERKKNPIEKHLQCVIEDIFTLWFNNGYITGIILNYGSVIRSIQPIYNRMYEKIRRKDTRKIKITTFIRVIRTQNIGLLLSSLWEKLINSDAWIIPKFNGHEHVKK